MHTVQHTSESPQNRPIACYACEATATDDGGCRCLADSRIFRKMREAVNRLLVKGADPARSDMARAHSRNLARNRLRLLSEQAEQADREREALRAFFRAMREHPHPRFSVAMDRDAICHMLGEYTGHRQRPTGRSVEEAAKTWRRPVAYLKGLRDQALRAMRTWPVETVAVQEVA